MKTNEISECVDSIRGWTSSVRRLSGTSEKRTRDKTSSATNRVQNGRPVRSAELFSVWLKTIYSRRVPAIKRNISARLRFHPFRHRQRRTRHPCRITFMYALSTICGRILTRLLENFFVLRRPDNRATLRRRVILHAHTRKPKNCWRLRTTGNQSLVDKMDGGGRLLDDIREIESRFLQFGQVERPTLLALSRSSQRSRVRNGRPRGEIGRGPVVIVRFPVRIVRARSPRISHRRAIFPSNGVLRREFRDGVVVGRFLNK